MRTRDGKANCFFLHKYKSCLFNRYFSINFSMNEIIPMKSTNVYYILFRYVQTRTILIFFELVFKTKTYLKHWKLVNRNKIEIFSACETKVFCNHKTFNKLDSKLKTSTHQVVFSLLSTLSWNNPSNLRALSNQTGIF